ncbi:hypothetical protein [Nocardioides sp. WS12]|uniref:hypothetical protein n=1 Tax=Nocardioides sp. WS12 TaxID=2486272 RepID=UPI0015F8CA73|nr:hypothetical protein [Nocardioides sp. WS12]
MVATARRGTVLGSVAVGVLVSVGVAFVDAGLGGVRISGAIEDMAPEFTSVQWFEHVGTAFVVAGALVLVAMVFLRGFVRNWWVVAAVAVLSLPITSIAAAESMFGIARLLI